MNSVMAGEKAKDNEFEIIAKMARKQWLKNHDYLLSDEEIDRAIERVRNERKSE